MTLAYDGTNYAGWQIQPNALTIQEVIEKILNQITGAPIFITGSGRTDAGVHANGQVCHFDLNTTPISIKSLNALLPPDIRILSINETHPTFHSRFSAIEKTYIYHVTTDRIQSPFQRRYALHNTFPLDLEKIFEAIPYFLGKKNFTSFANELSPHRNPVKTLHELAFIKTETGFILKFRGDGFLYKMVRNITGTLLDIGRGQLNPKSLPSIFESKSRCFAGKTAPPHALFLEAVLY